MVSKALQGIRVVEYCQLVSGPYCTKLLADLGAEVVKIEKPGSGDQARRRGPFLNDIPHPDRSLLFVYLNTNKLGITLNLKNPTGRTVFRELVKSTDVLVEDNPPQTVKELGLDYETLKETNNGLIMISITPFGHTGPYRNYRAYYLNIFHSGGEGYVLPGGLGWSLYPERQPLKGGGYLGDYDGGVSAAVATMGALFAREATGLGQHVDISKQESEIMLNRDLIMGYAAGGLIQNRSTRAYGFGGILPCKDGYVMLQAVEEHHWQAFVDLMGNPVWAKDERFRDRQSRTENAEELNQLIREWMKDHTKEEIYHGGESRGCPVAPCNTAEEVLNSEQLKARGFFAEIEHPQMGKFRYPSAPYKFSETPSRVDRCAPFLGEHNEAIYCGRLGYTKQDLVKMREAGVI